MYVMLISGLPWWLSSKKNSNTEVSGVRFHPGIGRIPGQGNGNPLKYSCLGNTMERGA